MQVRRAQMLAAVFCKAQQRARSAGEVTLWQSYLLKEVTVSLACLPDVNHSESSGYHLKNSTLLSCLILSHIDTIYPLSHGQLEFHFHTPPMASAFFYGTLVHPEILKRVIGHEGSYLQISPALLPVSALRLPSIHLLESDSITRAMCRTILDTKLK